MPTFILSRVNACCSRAFVLKSLLLAAAEPEDKWHLEKLKQTWRTVKIRELYSSGSNSGSNINNSVWKRKLNKSGFYTTFEFIIWFCVYNAINRD